MQAGIHLQMWGLWILCSLQKWASRTNKCLFFRPFFSYSRAPQVLEVAGAQSCSWYFIGILQLRETAALETMLQLPPLGRLGFILLNCSPKNTDLDSQVRCTFLCAALLAQNGHRPTWTCSLGWCGWGEHVGGLLFSEAASEVLRVGRMSLLFKSTKAICVCKDYVPGVA